jgi:hypothetical protein
LFQKLRPLLADALGPAEPGTVHVSNRHAPNVS